MSLTSRCLARTLRTCWIILIGAFLYTGHRAITHPTWCVIDWLFVLYLLCGGAGLGAEYMWWVCREDEIQRRHQREEARRVKVG